MKRLRVASLICATSLLTERAWADPPDAVANRHFQQALTLLGAGTVDVAITEFEEAYRISPRYEVLYNLGLAYGLGGRPAEAIVALQRYLDEGGSRVAANRRTQVEATLAIHHRLTGNLMVTAQPVGAALALDGKPILPETPVRVTAGRHVVVATLDGFRTVVKPVDIEREIVTKISLQLEPSAPPSQPKSAGLLEVQCPTPDVNVMVDDVSVARTPLVAALPIPTGRHRVTFTRVGYVSTSQDIELRPRSVSRVTCDLRVEPELDEAQSSLLRIDVSEEGAQVWVDGRRHAGERLPNGRHTVVVEREGFEPWRGEWLAGGGASEPLVVVLNATLATRRASDDAVRVRRTWGLIAGGMGMACGVVAGGLVLLGSRESAAWRADRSQLSRELAAGAATRERLERAGELNQRAANIQRIDDFALVAAIGGAALVALSIDLLFFQPSPARSKQQAKDLGRAPAQLSF